MASDEDYQSEFLQHTLFEHHALKALRELYTVNPSLARELFRDTPGSTQKLAEENHRIRLQVEQLDAATAPLQGRTTQEINRTSSGSKREVERVGGVHKPPKKRSARDSWDEAHRAAAEIFRKG